MKHQVFTVVIAFSLTVAAASSAHAAAVLAGYWTLDENPAANGATLVDSSGSATQHDGTLATSLGDASVAGQIGTALDFSDAATSRVLADVSTDFVTGAGAVSIAYWFNPESIGGQQFMHAWGINSAGRNVRATIEPGGDGTVIRNRHQGGFVEWDASAVTNGSGWHHLAMVVPDGATTVGNFLVYIDGVLATKLVNDTDALNVGAHPTDGTGISIGSNYNAVTGFNGQIDDVGYWVGALTAQEVSDIYTNGLAGIGIVQGGGGGDIPTPAALPAGLVLVGLIATRQRRS